MALMEAPRFATHQSGYQTETGLQTQSDSLSRLLDQLFGLLRRQYLLIISVALLVVALGGVYLFTTPPVYTSHAKILIDTNKTRAIQQQTGPIIYFQTMDLASIMTQVELLKSDGIALAVVKGQHLAEDPAFVGGGELGILGRVSASLFGKAEKLRDTRSETERTRAAVG